MKGMVESCVRGIALYFTLIARLLIYADLDSPQ